MFKDTSTMAKTMAGIARRAKAVLPKGELAYRIARGRAVRPIDYMRHAEFAAILEMLNLRPGMRVLDIGSPQFFSLYLALAHPEVTFVYINLMEDEFVPYRAIAQASGLGNIEYRKADVRALPFADASFNVAVSISVIEHIDPEDGGDYQALADIRRVLVDQGELLLTVPFKARANVVYMDGPVYERAGQGRKFFAREYDDARFTQLVGGSGFSLRKELYISEKSGMLPIDHYEWGEGKNTPTGWLLRHRRIAERLTGISVDASLAHRYLDVTTEKKLRLVNIAAALVNIRGFARG